LSGDERVIAGVAREGGKIDVDESLIGNEKRSREYCIELKIILLFEQEIYNAIRCNLSIW